jgi:hypothetical protein
MGVSIIADVWRAAAIREDPDGVPVEAKLGLVTDIWNPGPPVRESNPGLASVIHAVDKLGLKPVKFAGGHGNVGDYAQAEKVVKSAEKK